MILVSFILLIVLVLLVLVYFRRKKPHSEKKAREQEQVDKKAKSSDKPLIPTTSGNGKSFIEKIGERVGFGTNVFWRLTTIALIGAIFYWGSEIQVSPSEIGRWGQNHWLQILVVYGIGAGFIWLNAEEKTAKTLQKVLAGVVFMTIIGFPLWSWSTKPSDIAQQTNSRRSVIPMTSDPKEFWYKLALPESKISERIAIDPGKTVAFHGKEFRIHCVYRDGHEISFLPGETPCPKGDMPWAYVTNEAKGENIILYAFALI